MQDMYLQNPDLLEGQPKRTISNYVEENGILVPRRFDSLAEARRSHKGILLRSEHQQEYAGISGLLESFPLSSWLFPVRGSKTLGEVKEKYFQKEMERGGTPLYQRYCDLLEIDESQFMSETSFSAWENLGGFNRTVVADSAIPNKYHVMTFRSEENNSFLNYVVISNGEIENEFLNSLSEDLRNGLDNLIETYEKVRNLGNFNPNHCPIMEFQTHKGKDYFLQYHRTRDFQPTTFNLERKIQEDEVEAFFVRGATPENGIDCKVTVYYGGEFSGNFEPQEEDGSFDFHYNWVFSESQLKKRKIQMLAYDWIEKAFSYLVSGHAQRSKFFKPEISTIIPIELLLKGDKPLLDGDELDDFVNKAYKTKQNAYMNIHVESDGNKAYISRI